MKVLFVNVGERSSWVEEIDDPRINGVLDLAIHLHSEKYKSYAKDVFHEDNAVIFGAGNLPWGGTQRASFIFRSPLHGSLHCSTMGDLGEYVKRAGINAVCIEGKSDESVFVKIKNQSASFEELCLPQNIFITERELYYRLHGFYGDLPFRIVLAGTGANTSYGCLVSSKHGRIGVVPDVAGRGGAGSVLYKAHNVVGFSVGGKEKVEIKTDKNLAREQIEATKKYRELGTFAANYPHLGENVIFMNWKSALLSAEERRNVFEKFIKGELLKGYTFSSETCGELCVAACKKYESKIKLDYEPAQGLGPFIGIFNRTYIKDLVHTADSFGFDAIYLGNVLGIVFEALDSGLLPMDYFSLDEKPVMNPASPDSEKNFMLAKYFMEKIAGGEFAVLGERIRVMSKELGIRDIALYIPHGSEFDMTPNFYWSLGLMLPVAMHGKYYSDYHTVVKAPEEYALICAERTVKEYVLDNLGICRFHRGWVESKLPGEVFENAKLWIKMMWEYKKKANALPCFVETKRALDVITALFREHGSGEWRDADESRVREYWGSWERKYKEVLEIF